MGTTEDTESTDRGSSSTRGDLEDRLIHGELTGSILQTAYDVHAYFGCGFLEKVYERALVNRLSKAGLQVDHQFPLNVMDEDGTIVGNYVADLIVDKQVLVEIKAVRALLPEHQAQILNYLKTTGLRVGMLINFGASKLQTKRLVY